MQDQTNPESMKEFGAAFLTSLQEAVVRDEHVAGALHDLAFDGSALTRSLLGARLRLVDGRDGSA